MNDSTNAVQIQQLTLQRGGANILDGVTFDVPQGAVVGLVGRNGAGKSSLLGCLTGLIEPTGGTSTLLGCPSLQLSDAVCARLGYVAQSADLFEWMTVEEHLAVVGRAYPRWSEARCKAVATRLGLSLRADVNALSGGDKQKLAVVLALGHDPDLLLLDEPVASLDPLSRRQFMSEMFGNRADATSSGGHEGERTVIISSHILSDLERVVSHVAFLREGRLQLFDTWDNMLVYLRLAPVSNDIPDAAIVFAAKAARQVIVDTRRAPALADSGAPLTLDELFVELNK
jgi:ABC-2 type transport system ATP-binding protein